MQYSHKTRATSPGPGPIVRWLTSGAPLGSQSLSGVAAKRLAGWSPEAGRGADSGRADGAGTGAGAAARRTRKDRQLDLLDDNHVHVVLGLHAPGLGVGGDIVLRAPLVRLLLKSRRFFVFCLFFFYFPRNLYQVAGVRRFFLQNMASEGWVPSF